MDKQNAISFTTTAIGGNPNSTRESEAHRLARASHLFQDATFLGVLGYNNAQAAVVDGKTLTLPNGEAFSTQKPDSVRCSLCSGINGEPKGKFTQWNAALLAKMAVVQTKDGKLVFLSDTCRAKYFEPMVGKLKAGATTYRTIYPKAPVKA